MLKKCNICKQELPLEKFSKDKLKKDGLSSHCQLCNKIRCKKWYEIHKNGKWKNSVIFKLYGITLDQYNDKCVEQDHRCLICGKSAKLHIDHSHETGKVRGLLCQQYNQGLGNFRENIVAMKNAIDYLERQG